MKRAVHHLRRNGGRASGDRLGVILLPPRGYVEGARGELFDHGPTPWSRSYSGGFRLAMMVSRGRPGCSWLVCVQPMTEIKLEVQDEGLAIAIVGRVMVVIWRGTPTAERMRMLKRVTERMLADCADGFCQIQVIEANSPPPDSEQRKASAQLLERMRGAARGIAFVIEGDGARPAIVRTILRGMSVLSRGGVPKFFFAHVHEALTWIGPVLELTSAQSAQLERAMGTVRKAFKVPPIGAQGAHAP
jgi:hypothetical protein